MYTFIKRLLPNRIKRFIGISINRFFPKNDTGGNMEAAKRIETKKNSGSLLFSGPEIEKQNFAILVSSVNVVLKRNEKVLLFIERGAIKNNSDWLINILVKKTAFIVFKSKNDFEEFIQASNFTVEQKKRVTFIQRMATQVEEAIRAKANSYSDSILENLQSYFSGTDIAEISNDLQSMKAAISDRLVPWLRNEYFLSSLVTESEIDQVYYVGNGTIAANLLAFRLQKGSRMKARILEPNSSWLTVKSVDLLNVLKLSAPPLGRTAVTRYMIAGDRELTGEYIALMETKKDYEDTDFDEMLNQLEKDTNKKLLFIRTADNHLPVKSKNVDFLLPKSMPDDLPLQKEYATGLDVSLNRLIKEGFAASSHEGIVTLYAVVNCRRAIHQILRQGFAIKRDIDSVVKKAKITSRVQRQGRSLSHDFVNHYLKDVPSIKIRKKTPFDKVLREANNSIKVHSLIDLDIGKEEKTLLFIESGASKASYNWVHSLMEQDNVLLVFKAKRDFLDFSEKSKPNKDLAGRIHYIQGIDPELDEKIYAIGDEYADAITSLLQKNLCTSVYHEFAKTIPWVKVSVSDRLVPFIRNVHFLASLIKKNGIKKYIHVGTDLLSTNIITFVLQQRCNVEPFILDISNKNWGEKVDLFDFAWELSQPLRNSRITSYDFSEHREKMSESVLFVGNFKDPQYRETLLPILNRFTGRTNKEVFVITPAVDDFDKNNLNVHFLTPSVQMDELPGGEEFEQLLDESLNRFIESGFEQKTGEGLLRLYVAINNRRALFRVLRECFSLKAQIDTLSPTSKISAIVSNPGRLWVSQFLVGYLQHIPSVEIGGVISKSRRYKKPHSHKFLAIDDYSKSVYVDYMKIDPSNVEIVGSPRIDAKLEVIRGFTQSESRMEIAFYDDRYKILCVATQPYGTEIMTSMVTVAAKFVVENPDWFLLITMHPNETVSYENAYQSILSSFGIRDRASISRKNVYHNLNASDAVITYFSTTGLEAFCLDKAVFAFRSADYPTVPFDLCEFGVARPFMSSEDLSGYLSDGFIQENLTEGLLRLRDGRSVERICKYIEGMIEQQEQPVKYNSFGKKEKELNTSTCI
ncbi:hypothetical protein A8F94_08465 [Bacillus sp. FJAT-27225]|uniref:hypothetical protein n=1 Tax=Bacillus sp. FJAT-27225 TaxID=1743144 RepID=UPI00080C2499|nr:hypothetical protein [Bacillus sp. FJAT-27225]OCA87862.1 hypothetical protein A8F94_08465 [Bacillus sp. FJAT-27225]